jgi:hypothetical protein
MSIVKNAETVTIPTRPGFMGNSISLFMEKIKGLLLAVAGLFSRSQSHAESRISSASKLPKIRISRRTLPRIIIPVVLVLAILVGIRLAFAPRPAVQNTNLTIAPDAKPLATKEINKEFSFPIRDEKAKEVGRLSYSIENAELRKQIIVQGKRATTVDGRVFLILNLKVANTLNQGMEINTRDYIRISVNDSKEFFAPEIHNDPVEVQAISTKNTRLGLAINESDKNIKLQVGEIDGQKEIIPISF